MDRETDAASPAVPPTMTAWRQHRYGGPEAVAPEEVAVPAPVRGQVLLRVRATAINAGDTLVMRGVPLIVRLAFGLRRTRRSTPGMDVAGTVVAVGPEVTGFVVGDEVVGELPGGGLAPYTLAPVARLVERPAAVDAVAAASLPIAAGTAQQALDLAAAPEGGRILVIGASGGVGTFAVQLAVAAGLEVWALTGARSIDLVSGLGASQVFDYRTVAPGSAALPAGSFDGVLDIAGAAPLRVLKRLVRDGGRLVLVSGKGGRVLGPIGRLLSAPILSLGSRRSIRGLAATPRPAMLRDHLALVAAGRVVPVIERTFPLEDARAALAHVDAGHTVGKVVVVAG
ncbi:NAD(P)-dependent alcohol dehydrogenase [Microbacterium sp. NPDC019599]|uniref:NAD(P)-dependent alcohol dehydrogenase n=1 Tax=Microbacterium sp. NPDC019599 TaxID=3154690 RepID=UPI0033DC96E3